MKPEKEHKLKHEKPEKEHKHKHEKPSKEHKAKHEKPLKEYRDDKPHWGDKPKYRESEV